MSAEKPAILVVALDIDPYRGSEPAKGWCWANALSEFFQLHIITQPYSREACLRETSVVEAGWKFHATQRSISTWKFPTGYRQYAQWLKESLQIAAELAKSVPIVGLCHLTLGSFRMLPAYESLGIPYVLGPLGGGECSPPRFLWPRPVPLSHKLSEAFRPLLNNAFAAVPSLRKTMAGTAMTLATSQETEDVLRRMGARRTAVVFSDAYNAPVSVDVVGSQRQSQVEGLRQEIRLLWQGRPVWWKGPDIAISLLRHAQAAGILARLTMVSNWDSDYGNHVRALVDQAGLRDKVDFRPLGSRAEFLETMKAHHGYIGTSLHDSGGIPLVEAQSLGLPCITLGLGGNRQAACSEAGFNGNSEGMSGFLQGAVSCLRRWQDRPEEWLKESRQASEFAGGFTDERLRKYVSDHILPALPLCRHTRPCRVQTA